MRFKFRQNGETVQQNLPGTGFEPYLPRLAVEWWRTAPNERLRRLDGTLVSADISGFTALSERLQERGKLGAEELIGQISRCYEGLIDVALARGGDVLKFRGDALLIFFGGRDHALDACAAAVEMQDFIGIAGRAESSVGPVNLTMAVGIHSGPCHFFLVGSSHRELVLAGDAATNTLRLEDLASAGEILVADTTAESLPPGWIGDERDGAWLVAAPADLPPARGARDVEPAPDAVALIPTPLRTALETRTAEPEHRHVAAAFVKFKGADALVADEAEATAAIDELGRVVGEAADAHNVTWLESDIDYDGGKLYLLAGAPASAGDDDERMLRTLRAIVDAGTKLKISAGVNHGPVFAGEIGAPARRTYAVMGDTVNLAARLTGRATPGRILASRDVVVRARTRFETEPQPFLVKGKSEPIQALWIGAPVAPAAETDDRLLELVGRDAEVERLREALNAARLRQRRLVELVGEPGIGKSRLVEELKAQAVGFQQLVTRCQEYEASTPFFAFRSLLRPLVGITPEQTAPEAGAILQAWVASVMPDLAPWLPLLAIPFDATVPPTVESDELDPSFRHRKLHETLEQFLTRVLLMPTLLVFEDVHWIDDASRFFLHHLAASALPQPWVVCATRRPEGESIVGEHGDVLELRPLEGEHAVELALAAAGDVAIPGDAFADLVARSGGNPLFLRELVSHATDAGDELPETVERVITSRIDTLEPADRLLLRCAAVIGQSFDLDLLSEVLASESLQLGAASLSHLDEFIAWEDSRHLRFRHDLFRTVGYEGLSFGRRRELHRIVGEALERRAGEAGEEAAGLLSLHFVEAGEFDKAWGYAVVAGDRARAKYANVDAGEFYERALRAADELTPDPQEVSRIAEALGDVRELAARYDAATEAYERARGLVPDDGVTQTRLMLKEGTLEERRGRYREAMRWYRRGLEAIDDLGLGAAAGSNRAQLEVGCAVVTYRQGRHRDAVSWSRKAIEHAKDADDRDALAHAYYLLDAALTDLGEETSYAELALPIYEELGDLLGQGIVLNNLGIHAYYAGRWDEARELYRRSRDAKLRSGDVVKAAIQSSNEAEILSDQGHLAEAEELLAEALRVFRAAGHTFGIGFTTSNLGRAAARAGRFDDAHRLLDDALETLERIGSQSFALETSARIAECHVFEGRYRDAWDVATETLEGTERAEEVGPRAAMLERLRGYARVQGREADRARRHFDESLRLAREVGSTYEQALTLDALARTGLDASVTDDAQTLLDGLGVVSLPYVPLP